MSTTKLRLCSFLLFHLYCAFVQARQVDEEDRLSRPAGFESLAESRLVLVVLKRSDDPPPPQVIAFLKDAKIADGIKRYQERLLAKKDDHHATAALGLLQTASAIEGLAQDYYRFGFSQRRLGMIGLIQIPVPPNPAPEEISYADARGSVLEVPRTTHSR